MTYNALFGQVPCRVSSEQFLLPSAFELDERGYLRSGASGFNIALNFGFNLRLVSCEICLRVPEDVLLRLRASCQSRGSSVQPVQLHHEQSPLDSTLDVDVVHIPKIDGAASAIRAWSLS